MHIQTRLDPQILKAAKEAAKLEGTSLSEYLRRLVQRNLEAQESRSKVGNRQSKNESDSDRIR
jgi:hypothetical protein